MKTSRDGSAYGSGASSTASIALKTVAPMPMAIASVATTIDDVSHDFAMSRSANAASPATEAVRSRNAVTSMSA